MVFAVAGIEPESARARSLVGEMDMNRRSFLASAIAAALAPKALLAEPVAPYVARYTHETYGLAFAWTEEALEDATWEKFSAALSSNLAASMLETKEMLTHRMLWGSSWSKIFADAKGKIEVEELEFEAVYSGFGDEGISQED